MLKSLVGALLLLSLVACAAPSTPPPVEDYARDPRPLGQTLVYRCDDYSFTARMGPGEMAVWLENEYRILSRVRSASGVRYEEGDVAFFGKGEEGMLALGEREYRNCRVVPNAGPWEEARRRGVSFRAVGQEPGWHLEIHKDRHILFVGNYGRKRVLAPWVAPEGDAVSARYAASAGEQPLEVLVSATSCQDTMSDEVFPQTVTVTYAGETYRGCGRPLDYPWH